METVSPTAAGEMAPLTWMAFSNTATAGRRPDRDGRRRAGHADRSLWSVGWRASRYPYVPACPTAGVDAVRSDLADASTPPLFATTGWLTVSTFFQVTVSPPLIVTAFGAKAVDLMLTVLLAVRPGNREAGTRKGTRRSG